VAEQRGEPPRKRRPRSASDADEPAKQRGKPPRKRRPRSASDADEPAKQQKGGYGNDGGDTEERGESVGAHAAFVASHFGGGAEATPEILDRAIEVWQRLPGAVVRSPAQIRPNRPAAPASGYDENQDPDL
jgi:hypothetical protein